MSSARNLLQTIRELLPGPQRARGVNMTIKPGPRWNIPKDEPVVWLVRLRDGRVVREWLAIKVGDGHVLAAASTLNAAQRDAAEDAPEVMPVG